MKKCLRVGVLVSACVLSWATSLQALTINDFTIYGSNSVVIGGNSFVQEGLVGSDKSVQLNGSSHVASDVHSGGLIKYFGNNITVDGNLFSGNLVQIGSSSALVGGNIDSPNIDFTGAGVGGVQVNGNITYSGTFTKPENATVGGSVTLGVPQPPSLPLFPSATSFSAGATDVVNAAGPLAPGDYGNVSFTLGTFALSAGNYYFNSLSLSGSVQINLDVTGGNINLFVVGDVTIGSSKHANVIGGGWQNVYAETHGDWTHGGDGSWEGIIFAPDGTVHLGSGSSQFDFAGRIWAANVDIEHNVDIVPEPTSFGLTALTLVVAGGVLRRRSMFNSVSPAKRDRGAFPQNGRGA